MFDDRRTGEKMSAVSVPSAKRICWALIALTTLASCSGGHAEMSCELFTPKAAFAQVGDVVVRVARGEVLKYLPASDHCDKTWLVKTSEAIFSPRIVRTRAMTDPKVASVAILTSPSKFPNPYPGVPHPRRLTLADGRRAIATCHATRNLQYGTDGAYCRAAVEMTSRTSMETVVNLTDDSDAALKPALQSMINGVESARYRPLEARIN